MFETCVLVVTLTVNGFSSELYASVSEDVSGTTLKTVLKSCKEDRVYKREDNYMYDPRIDNYEVRCIATDLPKCSEE